MPSADMILRHVAARSPSDRCSTCVLSSKPVVKRSLAYHRAEATLDHWLTQSFLLIRYSCQKKSYAHLKITRWRGVGGLQSGTVGVDCFASMQYRMGTANEASLSIHKAVCDGPACREIQSFVTEPFWEIKVAYKAPDGKGACDFHWERGRLFDHAAAVMLYEPCVDSPLATVLRVRIQG